MAKRQFIAPSGKTFKSQRHYERSLRGMFASMNQSQRKKFKPISYQTVRARPVKIEGQKSDIKDAETETVKVVTFKSEKQPNGKYKLKKQTETARVNKVVKEDKDGNRTLIVESEESSRYTPSKVNYTAESLDENHTNIDARRAGRVVKSTIVQTQPSLTKEIQEADLQDRFVKYYQTPPNQRDKLDDDVKLSVAEKKVLAKNLGGIETGGVTDKKITGRIKTRLEKEGISFTPKAQVTQQNES